ncbi:hypothetical protein [Nocardioides pacificus]
MRERETQVRPVDVVTGVGIEVLGVTVGVTRRAGSALSPLASAVLRPRQLHAGSRWVALGERGRAFRTHLLDELAGRLDVLVPLVLTEVLRRADLTDLILQNVDLDGVARGLDVDGLVKRVDLDPIIDRVDLNAAAERLDLDAVMARLDLTAIILERVDLDGVVRAVLDRLDLVGLAAQVIDGVDLPEIIRESTGSMATDTVQGVRMQAIVADEAVGRAVDRLLLRRRGRTTETSSADVASLLGPASVPAQHDRPH